MSYRKIEPGDYPGIGGSDISAVLGLNRYRTALDFWEEIKGVKEPFQGNLPTELGLANEQFNIACYQKRTANIVFAYPPEVDGWYRRSPDGIIRTGDEENKLVIYEGKTSFSFGALKLFPQEEDGDQLPKRYLLQCQWYMAQPYDGIIAHETHLSALLTTPTHRVYTIEREDDVCSMMLEFAKDWWEKYVVGDIPPPKKQTDDARDILESSTSGKLLKIEDGIGQVKLEEYVEAKGIHDLWKSNLDKCKKALIKFIGDEDGMYGEWGKVTHKAYEQSRVSQDLLYKNLVEALGEQEAIELLDKSKVSSTKKKFYTNFK